MQSVLPSRGSTVRERRSNAKVPKHWVRIVRFQRRKRDFPGAGTRTFGQEGLTPSEGRGPTSALTTPPPPPRGGGQYPQRWCGSWRLTLPDAQAPPPDFGLPEFRQKWLPLPRSRAHQRAVLTALEWVRFWCLARSEALLNALVHPGNSHMYGFSPVWERRCVFRFSSLE